MDNDLRKYREVRKILINDLRSDLIGPYEKEEILSESPVASYITGILQPMDSDIDDYDEELEAIGSDKYANENMFRKATDEDLEEENKVQKKGFKQQSSIGFNFYIDGSEERVLGIARWGEYYKVQEEIETPEGETEKKKKKSIRTGWQREEKHKPFEIELSSFSKETKFEIDEGVFINLLKYKLKNTNTIMVAVFLSNMRSTSSEKIENMMFQVELEVYGEDGKSVFISELNSINTKNEIDDYLYRNKPVFSRGYGCAVVWENENNELAKKVKSSFIPSYEIPSVSTILEGVDEKVFSMKYFSNPKNKSKIIEILSIIPEKYELWINGLKNNELIYDKDFNEDARSIIYQCERALDRIKRGIELIENNDKVLQSFCFANQVMFLQRSMDMFSKKNSKGVVCSLKDELEKEHSSWRPFQIAFVLLNIEGIVEPSSKERDIVDLLFFPTGGGKTEAYLGIAAFIIGYRRISSNECAEYEKDGGVTVFLRYTLRLLTTQQRDRLLKMISAAEMIRCKSQGKFGNSEISIGFWVGGTVTPNKFSEFEDEDPQKVKATFNKLTKQIIQCPCCGNKIKDEDYNVDLVENKVEIHCSNKKCYFNKHKIPVFLVDEEIYRKCPTVIISTVDKFARLAWDEKTALLFGRTNRLCPRCGYISEGEEGHNSHQSSGSHKATRTIKGIKPFYPPELIIQDELHLITGPLGTIYGGYETAVEEMCKANIDGKINSPKYIVSTATIKNAGEQIRCLYGRNEYFQFPPSGFSVEDSFFAKEVSLDEKPFRLYGAVCANGQSMKTTLLRIYSVLLQSTENLLKNNEFKDYLDPYRTLIGYFNSVRELGGTVRLLDDDIPSRIHRLVKKYGYDKERYINIHDEITSRTPSYKIPQVLENLEKSLGEKGCIDAAIATNMIAVGMDIDRLGLMVVTGQPKLSSEYIQATSRVGRKYPGLVITVYNPYRPRDLSHYENFVSYHSQLYRYVEGTTATPFAARARDRVLHAIIVSLLRLRNVDMAPNKGAGNIDTIDDMIINEAKQIILDRVKNVEILNLTDTEKEIDIFLDDWKRLNEEEKNLFYYVVNTDKCNRLLNYYDKYINDKEKPTLNSMREVETASALYYYEGV